MSQLIEPYEGVTFELHDDGEGAPLLLLHGGGGPESVANLRERLAQEYRVLAPTHPGWERSARPAWFSGIDRLAEMYLDLLDDLDLHDVRVVGSSMGGWLAAELAIRDRGRRIAKLVLVDASGLPDHEPTFPDMPEGSEWADRLTIMQQLLDAYGVSDQALPIRLRRVTVPSLVVWGSDDAIIPVAAGEQYAALIPVATMTIIPDAGHVPTLERPDQAIPPIIHFLHD